MAIIRVPETGEATRHEIAKMDSRWIGPEIHGTNDDDDDDDDEVVRARPRHAIDNSRIFPALNRCHPIRGDAGEEGPIRAMEWITTGDASRRVDRPRSRCGNANRVTSSR